MPQYRRPFIEGGIYFFTEATYHCLPILSMDATTPTTCTPRPARAGTLINMTTRQPNHAGEWRQHVPLVYDAENRLVSVSGPSLKPHFNYDGDGPREIA